jgi:hypothetical protein
MSSNGSSLEARRNGILGDSTFRAMLFFMEGFARAGLITDSFDAVVASRMCPESISSFVI